MQMSSVDHHNQARAYADGIKDKLDELRQLNARMADLCNSAQQQLQNLGNEDGRFHAEMKLRVETLERFKGETALIEGLRDRLRAEQEKIQGYERRIKRVQSRVDAQKDKKPSWRKRASCECIPLGLVRAGQRCSVLVSDVLWNQGECACSGVSLRCSLYCGCW
jgi:uncharacterized coiled-coil DUF342 family protein